MHDESVREEQQCGHIELSSSHCLRQLSQQPISLQQVSINESSSQIIVHMITLRLFESISVTCCCEEPEAAVEDGAFLSSFNFSIVFSIDWSLSRITSS